MQIYDAAGSLDEDIRMIASLPESGMDGAIIAMLPHPRFCEAIYKVKSSGLPFVLIDDTLDQLALNSVMVDHYQGGYQVAQALLKRGHQRIGFIGQLAARPVKDRVMGLRDAVADAGLPLDRSLILDLEVDDPLGDWQPSIDRCTRVLMNRKDRPTAIFYSSDDVAANGYRTLKQLGLKIPEDISVVGFDGAPVCQWLEPPLATMNQPCLEMGQKAVQLLLGMIKNKTDQQAQTLVLSPQWVEGQSIGPVKLD
jgi:DNA-binding LacI/PurR family transcriptional regulator